jgi:SAM-dependent methyltransferase
MSDRTPTGRETRSCPICGHGPGNPFVTRRAVPVHQNQLCTTRNEARGVTRGDLLVCHCERCDFVWNAAFDLSRVSYGHAYDNAQAWSPAFRDHLARLVTRLVEEREVRNSRIVEVGCGNGDFLRRLVSADAGNVGLGFDPSYRGPTSDVAGRVSFEADYYRPNGRNSADVVLSRHVIEHIDDPVSMLGVLRVATDSVPDPRIFLETPDVGWILEYGVVWDFFYEHCSYFTPRSLDLAARRAGLHLDRVDRVFGEQYLWAEARPGEPARDEPPQAEDGLSAATQAFQRSEQKLWERLAHQVSALRPRGPVAVWGAGAKGVTFANQLDPDGEQLACVVDINPAKQGGFLPGTGHPIVSPDAAVERGIRSAIVLNPNYADEIRATMAGATTHVDVVVAT